MTICVHIPGIYQVYTQFLSSIYLVYTRIHQVYENMLVYTWYIPGIYYVHDHVFDMKRIYHLQSLIGLFCTSHVDPLPWHIPSIC